MTEKQIETNLEMIKLAMDMTIETDHIDEWMKKLANLQALHGLSSECIRYAKRNTLVKQGTLLTDLFKTGLNATAVRLQLESDMAEEIALFLYAERLGAGLVHCVDSCRTAISKLKEEYKTLN